MKAITANTGLSVDGRLMMWGFAIAGLAVIAWGVVTFLDGQAGAAVQAGLSLLLGGGFLAVAGFALLAQRKKSNDLDWLRHNGSWIKLRPVQVRTVTTDSVGRCESFLLLLEPTQEDRRKYQLDDVVFESEQIWARSVPNHYRDLEFDAVIDPASPHDRYFVNLDLRSLLKT